MKRIILTGGGTAGHVTPNIALLPALTAAGFDVQYIGSHTGIEKELIAPYGIPYYGIASGKLRRYLDVKNFTDIFRVVKGLSEAVSIIRKTKPDIVFSKGGFVTVPVVIAARLTGVPVVVHESDITPGLANRIAYPFAEKVCVNFPETLPKTPKNKGIYTGTPIREALLRGDRFEALRLCGFTQKPVILFTGGSLGAAAINACLRSALPKLSERYQIIHLCGKGNVSDDHAPGYVQFAYLTDELAHMLALADIVVSRAGANTIFELLALQKPHLLIPLSREASRGDQILNAASFEKQGFSMVMQESHMTPQSLTAAVDLLYADRHRYKQRMAQWHENGKANAALQNIMAIIRAAVR